MPTKAATADGAARRRIACFRCRLRWIANLTTQAGSPGDCLPLAGDACTTRAVHQHGGAVGCVDAGSNTEQRER